ncbi:MAG: 7,8-didemethyl-8-hydroxy-5-deazariboflavin synthase subunit CofG [Cyanobacteria bacterium J06641_5]
MPQIITYSPAYTLVPTYECFNRCSYCNFRADPGQSPWLSLERARQLLTPLQTQGVCEILILSGEVAPRSPRRRPWFERIYQLCELALEMGFLPHTNAGPLSYKEMAALGTVNVSMGLMLEQLSPRLQATVHRYAPSKNPQLRLQQLQQAGELKIPFTTGLLLGIGETQADWAKSLEAIAAMHNRWGHIQEIILQPHSPGRQQELAAPALESHQLLEAIALAREILPAAIAIQIPPNLLADATALQAAVAAGACDLGGLGPTDEVNPDYPHPTPESLQSQLAPLGWHLQPRLPVYPQFIAELPARLQAATRACKEAKFKNSNQASSAQTPDEERHLEQSSLGNGSNS